MRPATHRVGTSAQCGPTLAIKSNTNSPGHSKVGLVSSRTKAWPPENLAANFMQVGHGAKPHDEAYHTASCSSLRNSAFQAWRLVVVR